MDAIYDLFLEALRIFFAFGIPCIVAVVIAGVLGSLLQSFFAIQDPVINYAFRVVGIAVILGMFFVSAASSLQQLMMQALQ